MKKLFFLLYFCFIHFSSAQFVGGSNKTFTRADSLRGMLTPLRTCYDVTYYHLDITVDTTTQSIRGTNSIYFSVVEPFSTMQIDLFDTMKIEKIVYGKTELQFKREFNAVFITFPVALKKNSTQSIVVHYSGTPIIAKRAPWDGGFVWTRNTTGALWIATACQGIGASLWLPCKDHQSDKPDSVLLSVTVPKGLTDISNGRLRNKVDESKSSTRFDWFVSYPINTYNISLNIGTFEHFDEQYNNALTCDYYVQPYNLEKAREQFKQVKPMLRVFEKYFGAYPFYNDGYKLVETPYLGMEHQSAVAYGNGYVNGYKGASSSDVGLKFDFIIIHESGHEWWGNSVTSKDIADMWIHEGICSYSEVVYLEELYGKKEALRYMNAQRWKVGNTAPIIGTYNVGNEGSPDMYNKGCLMLHTLRSVVDNDSLWFTLLRGIANDFKYTTTSTQEIVEYVYKKTEKDFSYFFRQYLNYPKLPQLHIVLRQKGNTLTMKYKWNTDVSEFAMPIKITTSTQKFSFIIPTTSWQTMELKNIRPEEVMIDEENFYVDVKKMITYVDERVKE